MRTIYLHIGIGKTGTTKIQRQLASERRELLTHDVHYLSADGGATGAGHQGFGKSFIRKLPKIMVPPKDPVRIQKRIRQEIIRSKHTHLVISSENLELAEVGEVHEFFRHLPEFRVKIIVFVRSQDELAESQFNQLVKLKEEKRTFEHYLAANWQSFDALAMIDNWSEHFGLENIVCRIYDAAGQDVVATFLDCLDVPGLAAVGTGHPMQNPVRENPSIGFRALHTAWLLNSVEIKKRSSLYKDLFAQFAGDDVPALLFDSQQASAFRDRFARSNTTLTARYLNNARSDLGGRRYSDAQRDAIRRQIRDLQIMQTGTHHL